MVRNGHRACSSGTVERQGLCRTFSHTGFGPVAGFGSSKYFHCFGQQRSRRSGADPLSSPYYNSFTTHLPPNDTPLRRPTDTVTMKTTLFRPVALAASLLVTCALVGRTEKSGLVAHEWGTFTSLQG